MESLNEFAVRVGAKLKPTCLTDMPVISCHKNTQPDNFFVGMDSIVSWLEVKDPSGGLNGEGTWPFYLVKSNSGEFKIVTSG